MAPTPEPSQTAIIALLRTSRGAYAQAVNARLREGGFDDLPHNGPFLLGGISDRDTSVGALIRDLGVSKQAASRLIDVLVIRGYLETATEPADRRRNTFELTERGRAAAAAARLGVASVDGLLAQLCGPEEIAGLRAGLLALSEIREQLRAAA